MEIRLEKVSVEERTVSLTATAEELGLDLDLASLDSDVTYRVTHHRIENEIFLEGPVNFALKFTCARCLDEFRREFDVSLNLVLQLVADEEIEDSDETDDEFVVYPQSKETYNLDRHMRDLVSLEVPMKPLCREDCAGLCPQCGTNLNESRCDCRPAEVDPRWQGLKHLSNDN